MDKDVENTLIKFLEILEKLSKEEMLELINKNQNAGYGLNRAPGNGWSEEVMKQLREKEKTDL